MRLRPSGLLWVHHLPEHWEVVPLRLVARLGTGHTPDRSKVEYWQDCDIPWVTAADVSRRTTDLAPLMDTQQKISAIGVANSAAVVHPAETVMLCRTASVGLSVKIGVPMATTQAFVTWTCGSRLLPDYLLLLLRAMRSEWERLAYGSTHLTIYMPDLEALRIPLPPLEEQAQIVSMLLAESRRMDDAVSRVRRLLAATEERRSAAVWHLTRYGLRAPNRRPSAFPWIAEVPETWRELPMKRVGTLTSGAAFPDAEQGRADGELPYFKVRDFEGMGNEVFLASASNHVDAETAIRLRSPVLPPQSIVFPKIGAALLSNRRRLLATESCLDQNVMGLTVTHGSPKYFYYLLQTLDFGRLRMPGPVPLLNEQDAANLQIPVPPLEEQEEIAHALDQQIEKVEAMRSSVTALRQRLDERRFALIAAGVTGALDLGVMSGIAS